MKKTHFILAMSEIIFGLLISIFVCHMAFADEEKFNNNTSSTSFFFLREAAITKCTSDFTITENKKFELAIETNKDDVKTTWDFSKNGGKDWYEVCNEKDFNISGLPVNEPENQPYYYRVTIYYNGYPVDQRIIAVIVKRTSSGGGSSGNSQRIRGSANLGNIYTWVAVKAGSITRWKVRNGNGDYIYGKWIWINKKEYRIDNTGYVCSGWILLDNLWYYFDSSYCYMLKGWYLSNEDGRWYYLDRLTGYMHTNWNKINGLWYYFNPENNKGRTYYYDPSRGLWVYNGSENRPYGSMYIDEMTPSGYYVDGNGRMLINKSTNYEIETRRITR